MFRLRIIITSLVILIIMPTVLPLKCKYPYPCGTNLLLLCFECKEKPPGVSCLLSLTNEDTQENVILPGVGTLPETLSECILYVPINTFVEDTT